jgi:sortase A
VEALLIVAGLAGALGILPRFDASHTARRRRIQRRVGLAVTGVGLALAVATGATFAALSGQQPSGFGTLAQAQGPAPRGVSVPGPPTRLVIARLGIDTPIIPLRVVDGAWQTPAYAAGYLAGTGMDGSSNEVITGHDDRDGAVFRRLGELRAGDTIQVFSGSHRSRYTVTALRAVSPNRVDVLRPTRQAVLTLMTCTPYLVDTQRLVARATLRT